MGIQLEKEVGHVGKEKTMEGLVRHAEISGLYQVQVEISESF